MANVAFVSRSSYWYLQFMVVVVIIVMAEVVVEVVVGIIIVIVEVVVGGGGDAAAPVSIHRMRAACNHRPKRQSDRLTSHALPAAQRGATLEGTTAEISLQKHRAANNNTRTRADATRHSPTPRERASATAIGVPSWTTLTT